MLQLHATCVALGKKGVLLLGESGQGKSDLALRLIDRGAKLVSDDQVYFTASRKQILADAPERIAGLLEVRGLGIFRMPFARHVPVALVARLADQRWIERLPYPEPYMCLGMEIPQIRLFAFEPSAPIKIEMAVASLAGGGMTVGALKE